MAKKKYVAPSITVVNVGTTEILAHSGALRFENDLDREHSDVFGHYGTPDYELEKENPWDAGW